MSDDRFDLPEWMIERMRQEYVAELEAIHEDPDTSLLGFGWHGDKLSVYFRAGDKVLAEESISIEQLCDEPAKYWHADGRTDAEHHELIGAIAQRLREQSDRLFAVQKSLEVEQNKTKPKRES